MFHVFRKELKEALRNRQFFWTGLLMPAFFTAMAVFEFKIIMKAAGGRDAMRAAGMATGMTLLFLSLVPSITSQILAAYAFAGEKVQRSLEPLLATPLSDAEILAGKLLSAWLPGQIIGWMSLSAFLLAVGWFDPSSSAAQVLPPAMILMLAIVLQPLIGLTPCLITIMASSRVSEVRAAMQWGGIGTVPAILLLLAFTFLGMRFGLVVLVFGVLLMVAMNLILFVIALVLFSRERLISKWT